MEEQPASQPTVASTEEPHPLDGRITDPSSEDQEARDIREGAEIADEMDDFGLEAAACILQSEVQAKRKKLPTKKYMQQVRKVDGFISFFSSATDR